MKELFAEVIHYAPIHDFQSTLQKTWNGLPQKLMTRAVQNFHRTGHSERFIRLTLYVTSDSRMLRMPNMFASIMKYSYLKIDCIQLHLSREMKH